MRKVFKENKRFIVLTLILVILTSATSMITPVIIQLLNQKNIPISFHVMLLLFSSMFLSFIFQVVFTVFRENFAATFNTNYLSEQVQKLYHLSYDSFSEMEPTYLVNRIFSTVDTLYVFIITTFSTLINSVFVVLISLVLLQLLSWEIFLIVLGLVPLNYFGFKYINRKLGMKMVRMQEQSAQTTKNVLLTLSNIDSLKAQKDDALFSHLLLPKIKDMYVTLANTNKYAQIASNSINFINHSVQNLLYVWVSILVASEETPISDLMILSIVLPLFFSALKELSKVNIDLNALEASRKFIKTDLEENRELDGRMQMDRIRSISFFNPRFCLNDQLFQFNIKETLYPGDFVYLSGPSGTGKSSLLKLLVKFRKSEGIKVNGIEIEFIRNIDLRGRIAYLSQDPIILSDSLEKNISWGMDLSHSQKEFLRESALLKPLFQEKNWDTILSENGSNLSGGERQRINLARLALMDADVYILDESTSNIDQQSSETIFDSLLQLKKDKIVIFTSHDQSVKKFANKIIAL